MPKAKPIIKRQPVKARILPAKQQEPLSAEEAKELHGLIEEAAKSNHNLVELGLVVHHTRATLANYELQLKEARTANAVLHTRIAPLLHRLPVLS